MNKLFLNTMTNNRIITLIPSATEIISFLGLGNQLVGVSHECDFPESVRNIKKLTKTDIKTNTSSYNIHLQIEKILENSLSVYNVDKKSLKYLKPDIIITQDQCNVCAVDLSQVKKVTSNYLNKEVDIISLQPKSFNEIFENIEYVAKKLNVFNTTNKNKINKLLNRISDIRQKKKSFKNVICIEWCDPLMSAGNWIPDMVKIAGGNELCGINNKSSHWIDFKNVRDFNPEIIIFMPCGYNLLQTQMDVANLFDNNAKWKNLSAYKNKKMYLVDGNQYFNRPGPRIVDSLEILAEILNPNAFNYGYNGKGWINYFD